jgi:hypothetical protein
MLRSGLFFDLILIVAGFVPMRDWRLPIGCAFRIGLVSFDSDLVLRRLSSAPSAQFTRDARPKGLQAKLAHQIFDRDQWQGAKHHEPGAPEDAAEKTQMGRLPGFTPEPSRSGIAVAGSGEGLCRAPGGWRAAAHLEGITRIGVAFRGGLAPLP